MYISRAGTTDQYQITQIIRLYDIRLGDPDCTMIRGENPRDKIKVD